MPNQPRADNPHRSVRIPDALWQRAQALAARQSKWLGKTVTVSAVVRDALEAYCPEENQ